MKIRIVKENVNELMGPDPRRTYDSPSLDDLQNMLFLLGLYPGIGNVADIANAGISLMRGNKVDAFIYILAAVPLGGAVIAPALKVMKTKGLGAGVKALVPILKKALGPNWNKVIIERSRPFFVKGQYKIVKLAWRTSGNAQFAREAHILWLSVDIWWQLSVAAIAIGGEAIVLPAWEKAQEMAEKESAKTRDKLFDQLNIPLPKE